MTEKRYVLYKHTSPNNIVYIGITCQYPYEKRWQRGRGYIYNKRFYNDIKLFGWNNFKHEILLDNLTLEDANKMEIEYIAKYRSTDKHFGYNILEGGNAIPKKIKKQKQKVNKTIENKANTQTKAIHKPAFLFCTNLLPIKDITERYSAPNTNG